MQVAKRIGLKNSYIEGLHEEAVFEMSKSITRNRGHTIDP